MPTFPDLDPTKLPAYPKTPHKTGQARVFIDDRSQYLGRFGTNESHALYHLMCLRKLLDGQAPATKELREELRLLADAPVERVQRFSSVGLQIVTVLAVAVGSGVVGYFATRTTTSAAVTANRPVLTANGAEFVKPFNDVADASVSPQDHGALGLSLSDVIDELRVVYPDRSMSELYEAAATRIRELQNQPSKKSPKDESTEEANGSVMGATDS